MRVIFFEDLRYIKFWFPIFRLNPFFKLSFFNPFVKNKKSYLLIREEIFEISRNYFRKEKILKEVNSENALLLSSFFIPEKIKNFKENTILAFKSEKVGIFLKRAKFKNLNELLEEFNKNYDEKEIKGKFINTPFKLISEFEEILNNYLNLIKSEYKRVSKNLYSNSKISKNVEIDTKNGIVIIEENVEIEPFSFIKGPAFIRKGTIVKSGSKIYSSYIGPVCRIGGEVDTSLFTGYSNKSHQGFIGHSIIGEWVNLGAMTTNSDLKNNYSEVRLKIKDETISTGTVKFGAIIGDHVKTGIGTLIPTGAYIDFFTNIFSGGKFCPKYIPPFSWVSDKGIEVYKIDKAIETAKRMMKRRNLEMGIEYEKRISKIFKEEIEK